MSIGPLGKKIRERKLIPLHESCYYLIEVPFDMAPDGIKKRLLEFPAMGKIPVLAHPERYLAFIRSPKKTLQFRNETGALLQLNADTVLSPRNYWERRFTEYLLKEGAVDAIASDAHDCINRPVNMEAAYQWLTLHTDATYAKELVTFGGELT